MNLFSDKIYKVRKWITDIETWSTGDPNKTIRRWVRKKLYNEAMKWIRKI